MEEKIVARIASAIGVEDILERLARLPATDLQSLLLSLYRRRSAERSPADLLAQYERSGMLRPSTADSRRMSDVFRTAFECAAAFEAVELSPIAPLGLNRVLGEIDQNNCLATVRGAEVLADPTTLKALECAHRRRAGVSGAIRLCSGSRQLRLQPFDAPGFSPHFGLFSLVTADRDRGGLEFEMESLREHLEVYLGLLERLSAHGYDLRSIRVAVSDTSEDPERLRRAELEVSEVLSARFSAVDFGIDLKRQQGRRYYSGLCFGLFAKDIEGEEKNLADGGFTDWTRRLLSNAKERLLVSGMGIELLVKRFLSAEC
ncbi:MAG TPA: hypothetical protein VKM94_01080 [Blastocatellia bacterium]|nr:hypothetical protein [Blastocatellia bacterium]